MAESVMSVLSKNIFGTGIAAQRTPAVTGVAQIPLAPRQCRDVRAHLDRILRSEAFAGSRRSQEFLRYVVEETLAGRGAAIKERNIAVDVFGRNGDFDSQKESIVRVKAVEVRRRLAQAYDNGAGAGLRIELPAGSYHPAFRFEPPSVREEAAPNAARDTRLRHAGPAVALLAGALLAGGWLLHRPSQPPLDRLWETFAGQDRPVLLSLPAPTVLELEHPERWLPLRPGEAIPSSELQAKVNYYVGVGAALGAARFAEQLTLRRQAFNLKFGSDVTFADLKQAPALLLGAYSSIWTMDLTRQLRYRFDSAGAERRIFDSWPGGKLWREDSAGSPPARTEGYALVTRLINPDTGHPLLMAAGISAPDTQAAVEFLTREAYFDAFARLAPGDWAQRNFQIVIRGSMHGHSVGRPAIEAWYVW